MSATALQNKNKAGVTIRKQKGTLRRLFLSLLFVGCFTFFANAGNLSDASGTITTGGTSQQLLAASTSPRTFFVFQNISTHVMWIGVGTAAVQSQPSIQVAASSGIFRMDVVVSDDALFVISSTTADAFVCKYR